MQITCSRGPTHVAISVSPFTNGLTVERTERNAGDVSHVVNVTFNNSMDLLKYLRNDPFYDELRPGINQMYSELTAHAIRL